MAIWTYNRNADASIDMAGEPFFRLFSLAPSQTTSTLLEFTVSGGGSTVKLSFMGTGLSYVMSAGKIVDITGGTITSSQAADTGEIWFRATGLSFSAIEMFDSAKSRDVAAQIDLLSGGDDRISGTNVASGDNMIGVAGNDTIFGFGGTDTISGGAGNDLLYGGTASDVLQGGPGADHFVFDTKAGGRNVDRLADFSHVFDRIDLENAAFAGLGGAGALSSAAFRAGNAATDASDRIIYDAATGRIFHDSDGLGGVAKVLFATVAAGTTLDHTDFFIV